MNPFHVIIPARLESVRLPGKPLADLGGRPLVVRVLQRALEAGATSVHVATDARAVAEAVAGAGGGVVMTRPDHASGTDRLAEAVAALGLDDDCIVVNLQGDEPFMPAACLRQVADLLCRIPQAQMATLWRRFENETEWRSPDVVKLVADAAGRALYFSRAPVPQVRDGGWPAERARAHVGLYAYRVAALREWQALAPGVLERLESLEQLRALEAGWTIACARAEADVPAGIDTPGDLEAARQRLPQPPE